ncbi:MAG: FHA domain-containing protein [Deltaproteobacteria bacterium]|nr:FHA domain-containing protein [Deltaproteobacteria bacterium]
MDCPSCGATGQSKARCEACGFAFPMADAASADDGALSLFLGLVCGTCDAYNDPGTSVCLSCGAALHVDGASDSGAFDAFPDFPVADEPVSRPALVAPIATPRATTPLPTPAATAASTAASAPPSWMTPPTGSPLSTQFAMKKVDLAVVGGGGGLAAPIQTPGPLSAPPTIAAPQAAVTPAQKPAQKKPHEPIPLVQPSSSSPEVRERCWRCEKELEPNDKFCRNCGARTDGGVGSAPVAAAPSQPPGVPAVTQMIASLKLPNQVVGPGAPGATMVLPALRGLGGPATTTPPGGHAAGPTATLMFGAASVERVAKLILVRGQSQFGSQWRLQAGETVIGRSTGMILFPDDTALAARHARLVFRGPDLYLEPEVTQNGAFMRLREAARLAPGDEFVVGAQRLKLLLDSDRPVVLPVAAASDPSTRFLGSMVKPNPPMAIARIGADQRFHEVYFRAQRLLTIGRVHCDVNFPVDGFVSERHAQLTNEGSHVTLEDLKSRNGTYVRVREPVKLLHGDLLLVGDQVLRVELPQR